MSHVSLCCGWFHPGIILLLNDMSVQCPSCKESFDWEERRPKHLLCTHSICSSCLKPGGRNKRKRKVKCSVCLMTNDVDVGKIQDDAEVLQRMDFELAVSLEEKEARELSHPIWGPSGRSVSVSGMNFSSVVKRSISEEKAPVGSCPQPSVPPHEESKMAASAIDVHAQVRNALLNSTLTLDLSEALQNLNLQTRYSPLLKFNLKSGLDSKKPVERAAAGHVLNWLMSSLIQDDPDEPAASTVLSSCALTNDEEYYRSFASHGDQFPLSHSIGKDNKLEDALEKGKIIYYLDFCFKDVIKRILIALEKEEALDMCKRFVALCNTSPGYRSSKNVKCCPETFVICAPSRTTGLPKQSSLFVPSAPSNIPPVCGSVVMDSPSRDKHSDKWQVGSAFRIRLCKNDTFYGRAFGSVVSGIQVAFDMASLGTQQQPYDPKETITIVDCGRWPKNSSS